MGGRIKLMLNPRVVTNSNGVSWLEWDNDGSQGYHIYVDGQPVTRTWKIGVSSVRLGRLDGTRRTYTVVPMDDIEDDAEEVTYPAPPPPPPPPLPPPSSGGMPDRSLQAWLAQPKIAGLPVQTVSLGLWDGNPRAGTLLWVTGGGQVSPTQASRLCSWRGPFAAVQLDPTARFEFEVPMSSAISSRKDLAVFGGLLGGHLGYGVRFSGASRIQWWGGTIRDCGRTGLLVHGNVADCDQLDLAFAISRCGLDAPNSDPHSERGTGYHGAYLADTGGSITNVRAAFWVTDQPYGAACQMGPALRGARIWVDARRVTFRAQRQVAGNALQWWGGTSGNTVEYVYGEDLAGRLSETDGGAGSGNRILVGRYRNVRLSPVCAAGVPCADLKHAA